MTACRRRVQRAGPRQDTVRRRRRCPTPRSTSVRARNDLLVHLGRPLTEQATVHIGGDARAWCLATGLRRATVFGEVGRADRSGTRLLPATGQAWRVPSAPWRTPLHWSPAPTRASARRSRACSLPPASPSGSAPATPRAENAPSGRSVATPGCTSSTSPTRRASPPPHARQERWTSWSTTRASPATARQQTVTTWHLPPYL